MRELREDAFSKASPVRRLLDETAGIAAAEFALISPAMLAILLGMFSFGIAMKDDMVLTIAVSASKPRLVQN